MNITLKLYDDQGYITEESIDSSVWIFMLNGEEFPKGRGLMTLKQAHAITNKLLDIEDYMVKTYEDE